MTSPAMPRSRRTTPPATVPLRVASITVDGTVTRRLRLDGDAAETWLHAIREAMLKRGCLRDRAHQGQCLNCALLPQCAVWPLIAPADPTRRQPGAFVRAWVPQPPSLPAGTITEGTRVMHAMQVVQDGTFPMLWGRFAAAYVQASRQVAEWGFGQPVPTAEGPARRGALSVGHVYWRNPVTEEAVPFALENDTGTPPLWYEEASSGTESAQGEPPTALTVAFITPLRLVAAGETRRMPDLPLLMRRIDERVSTFCTALRLIIPPSAREDAAEAAITAARVRIAADETDWIGTRKDGGLIGTITLNGAPDDLAALLPLLRWGTALGVGKGTQTGGGRITVAEVYS